MMTYTIDLTPVLELTDDQFYKLCRANPEVKFEITATGDLIVMSPTGGETGVQNSEFNADFVIWNRQTRSGYVFDSSTCFNLPNGAKRSPDVAWIQADRWNTLTPDQKKRFPPIAPDFVLELLSPSDSLRDVQAKMQEYIESGVKLSWLIDPEARRVEIYRSGQEVESLDAPETLLGEDVLPGFSLNLSAIW